MGSVPDGDEAVRDLFVGQGVRYSRACREVVACLREAGRPRSAEDLRRRSTGVSYSSMYRTLNVLEAVGVARRLVGADGIAYFELTEAVSGEHHHHLVCSICGLMTVLVLPALVEEGLATAATAVERTAAFVVESHRVELIGRCLSCQALRTDDGRDRERRRSGSDLRRDSLPRSV